MTHLFSSQKPKQLKMEVKDAFAQIPSLYVDDA